MSNAPSDQTAAPISIMPVRRDLHFGLPPERIGNWHQLGGNASHFFNALSLFFPDGERFFIHSVRNYRERIQDPTLNRAITAFIGQEAMHSREHAECNELLDRAGLPGSQLQRRVAWIVGLLKSWLPKPVQLSVTIALEHLTAIMANGVLEKPSAFDAAHPAYGNMWHWHALEETEHKAVAYDVWNQVSGSNLLSYLLRCTVLVLATLVFAGLVVWFQRTLVHADPAARAETRGGRVTFRYLFGKDGIFRSAIRDWFDYFRPGFHPWMHDNRRFLVDVEPLADRVRTGEHVVAA